MLKMLKILGSMFCKLKPRMQLKIGHWLHTKISTSNRSLSPTSQNNSPYSEKGATGNFYDSEKRQDISNASRDLLCSNSFDALSKTTGQQVKLTENDNDLIQENKSHHLL
uniref:Putative ovule protein n=1 Tax=Solanum chacoense TaxID=4108 RepID=A0A0V0GZ89_SOLCH